MKNNIICFSKWKYEIAIFSCGLFIGILFMYLMVALNVVRLERTKYAYVDVEQIIAAVNQNINQEIEVKHISENQIDMKLTKAKTQFDIILEDYSLNNNAIIISSHKVISGADNITKYITDEILERIK